VVTDEMMTELASFIDVLFTAIRVLTLFPFLNFIHLPFCQGYY
jgi:hypothetical protein